MATDFYFHSLSVNNFRAFASLKIEKFRRINIVGGFNGVGKSALLETLFFILDRRNPVAIVKPMLFRRFESSSSIDPRQFFKDSNSSDASLNWATRTEKQRMDIKYELKPADILVSVDANIAGAPHSSHVGAASSFSSQYGLSLRTYQGQANENEEGVFVMAAQSGMTGTIFKVSSRVIPRAQVISTSTRQNSRELAQILAIVVRSRRLREVVSYLQILHPGLKDLQTLQEGEEAQVYAVVGDDELLPVQYMGDGFQNLLHTLAAIINCAGGVVLLDEIDAAMHYSVITDVWKIISEVASKENCQIIATTHSRECIYSAAKGITLANKNNDFQYLRLEKDEGIHRAVSYSMSELGNAEEFDIEIR